MMGYPVPHRINKHGSPSGPVTDASEEVRLAMIAKYGCSIPNKELSKPPSMNIPKGNSERSKRAAATRKRNESNNSKKRAPLNNRS